MIVENRPSNLNYGTCLSDRTVSVDRAVISAGQALLFPNDASALSGMALVAVGGYGRREMFPHSDVDLLILCESTQLAQERKQEISLFLQRLWDCGLRMSQSVRTPDECAEIHDGNTELSISLLDRRFLTGDGALFNALEQKMPVFLRAERSTLIRSLIHLTKERHAKYADTFFHLEPNVKETPGGLRDFQLIRWLEQLRGNERPIAPPELAQAFEFLSFIRCWLHEQAARDQNVFTFDSQDGFAEASGAGEVESLMREYFRHSRAVYRAASREIEAVEALSSNLFAQFRDWRSRLGNADIAVRRERTHFKEPQLLDADPDLALRLFEFVARHGIKPSLETEKRISNHLEALERHFAARPPKWSVLSKIFTSPHASAALRAMHETGILGVFFPEWKEIECQVIRDFYHRYTVDEHTIVAIESLLQAKEPYSGLLAEADQLPALVFSLLFHDVGKGNPEIGHVDESARLAEIAMDRIGVPAADREAVLFLIRNHLELSAVMQSRDIYDPQTIRDVAARVQTVERLKALTLLTYSDISAVNPTAMTPWRSSHLWQLYLAVYNELTRELESDRIEERAAETPEKAGFLAGFPKRYVRTHTSEEIAAHMALDERSRKRGAAVEVRRLDSAWQFTFAAPDRPGLFASAAGTLSSFGLNILRAEAFSNKRGLVLDSFIFSDPLRNLELNPTEVDRLQAVGERVLAGRADVAQLLQSRPRPALPSRRASFPSSVTFDSNASRLATLIEIVAADRPGLLYDVASALSSFGCNIEVVLIDTEAHKAIDVFYVTTQGRKLTEEELRPLGEALRSAAA